MELITIGSRPVLRGHPSTFFGVFATPQFVQALFTVYLLHELKVPGPFKEKTQAKNKRQLSNPWRAECSEGSGNGHEKRSGRCRALNATAPMFDNLVWLPRACLLVSAQKKRSEPLFSYLIARISAPAPCVFTLKDSLEVHFRGRVWPWN